MPENSTLAWIGLFILFPLIISGFMACQSGASSPTAYTLTVIKVGTGDGTITSSPSGLHCGEVCTASFKEGTVVTLTATPNGNSSFEAWSGDLMGTTNPRSLMMDRDRTVTVTFTRIAYIITGSVTVGGAGLEGVTMAGLPGNPLTDASGAYSATVNYGSNITVSPTLYAYAFDPASNTYTNVTADMSVQDYEATLIQTSQRKSLIALYNSTNGDGWTNNSGWKASPLYPDGFALPGTESTWHGLTVASGTQTVTGIDFTSNNLTGTLPAELGDLTSLANLNLYGNLLTGSIPATMGNLTALNSLSLANNPLTGSIPATLGNLTALQYLYLDNCQLTGSIPAEIGNLTALRELHLSDNPLTGSIPAEIGNLTALRELYLYDNQLIGPIPAELGGMAALQDLNLHNNQLSGSIPATLGNLTALRELHLSSNQLTGSIPATLGNLTALEGIYASSNQLSGSIPAELGSLSKLAYIYLEKNQLSGSIPAELGNLSKLRHLILYENELSGSIPPELGNLTSLQQIIFRHNQLSGEIPAELGNLAKLDVLRLGENQLSGIIPAALGNLANLQSLRLAHNQLSGAIPDTLGNLTQLWELWLHSNQLTGPIPTSLANLTALTATHIGYNGLYTSDEALITFLNLKESEWAATQTIAPAGITATSLNNAGIMVSWLPVAYTADAGYYKVLISQTMGGPYTLAGQTADKATAAVNVTGLAPGTRYYFVVHTVTNANAHNQNIVESDDSTEASALALLQGNQTAQDNAAAVVVPTITVTSPNGGETWAVGSAHAVTWTQTGLTGTVAIDLYKGGMYRKNLGTADATAGSFSWLIGAGETLATDYTILVWQSGYSDDSDASFASVPAVKVDFNKDGQEDILWRYYGSGGSNRVWFLGNTEESGKTPLMTDPQMEARTKSSGNRTPGKGLIDPWDMGPVPETRQESLTGEVQDAMTTAEERGSGAAMVDDPRRVSEGHPGPAPAALTDPRSVKLGVGAGLLSAPVMLGGADVFPVDDAAWEIAGVADFDKDTHADILWRHNGPGGENVIWLMDGTDVVGKAVLPPVPDLGWQVVGTGDFDNDTHIDILWRHSGGANLIWHMNGTKVVGAAELVGVSDPTWQIAGTGDFNTDGHVDVLWRYNGSGGYIVVWYLNGKDISGRADLIPVADLSWRIAGTGDYNNDGNIDILWRCYGPGGFNSIWYMDRANPIGVGEIIPVADRLWRIVSRQTAGPDRGASSRS